MKKLAGAYLRIIPIRVDPTCSYGRHDVIQAAASFSLKSLPLLMVRLTAMAVTAKFRAILLWDSPFFDLASFLQIEKVDGFLQLRFCLL
ncbi:MULTISPECIES: hypothetical protein [unclassified Paenibacillus]|uniref:hypothetical protein n=1 Tax=unclassified Paenibacillus TaxID=185978 RepID=UPI003839A95C